MDDTELISKYIATASHDAFGQIVRRHIDMVYAAAFRQTRDRYLADDVTQGVFIVLAKKAGTIRNPARLCCWLIGTTRLAANQARRAESRRRHHEQKAAAMTPTQAEPASAFDHADISALLDLGLSRLGDIDRSAIILRYLRGLSINSVGAELGLSANTAHKRIVRALAKLRTILLRNGIAVSENAMESTLIAEARCVAPSILTSTVIAHSFTAGASSGSAGLVAKMTVKSMSLGNVALIIASASAAMVILGLTTLFTILRPVSAAPPAVAAPLVLADTAAAPQPPASSVPPSTAPASNTTPLPNVTFTIQSLAKPSKDFPVFLDPAVTRNGQPTISLSSTTPQWGIGGMARREIDYTPFLGKRMRFSAYVKSENLANWGGIQMWAQGPGNKFMLNDDMGGRPITKTTDWQRYEVVADIPSDTELITIGIHLYGAGKLWMDEAQVDIVGTDVPVTDDSIWHAWSFSSPHYSNVMDPSTQRNGHPTLCLSSTVAKSGEWYAWDWNNRHPDEYRGKRLRMTAWIKTQNVNTPSGLNFRIMGDHLEEIAPTVKKLIRGNNDWKQYEVIADIPENIGCICSGFRLNGKGKLWLDDVKYEIVEAAPGIK